jgi:NADH-quinone oxidoreductase subunit J
VTDLLAGVSPTLLLAAAVAAATASLWLLLPRRMSGRALRWAGGLLGLAALAGFVLTGRRLGGLGEEAVFLIVSFVAIFSAAATVVTRSPAYAAIWFALALAGVSGVLLVLGAQFLGVATIIVYAGAILVMFLFVLMLAQPAGLAPYDRVSNEPLLSVIAGGVLLGVLSVSIGRLSAEPPICCQTPSKAAALSAGAAASGPAATPAPIVAPDTPAAIAAAGADPLAENHVARLGGELFGRHLLAVEVAGLLLLVALVGSIAIVSRNTTAAGAAAGLERSPA